MAEEPDDTEEGGAPPAPAQVADTGPPAAGPAPAPAATKAAAPSAAPAPSGPDFTAMVKSPAEMGDLQRRLADIQRAKAAANGANADEAIKRLETDRARVEAAYKASAVMPDELKSGWDAKAKMAEHSTDPLTAFGSLGSVFAMLAPAFAKLPMEASLNAGAAAMNAIHAGDAAAYQKEYEAWKANTDLALKRHEIQRQAYNDATNLMNSNINAGRTKMELAAARFGDQKAQALLDAGMDKELFDLIDSRNKAALGLQDQWDKVQLQHDKVTDLRSDPRYTSGDPAQKAAAIADWTQRWAPNGAQRLRYDFTKDYIETKKKENPNWTADDLAKWGKEAAAAQETEEGGSSDPKTAAGLRAQEIKRRAKEYETSGMSPSDAYNRAAREVGLINTLPSGNRIADDKVIVDQIDTALSTIEEQKALLKKYNFIAGTPGAIGRVVEKAGNITGISSNTDRQAFEKNVEKLRLTASRLMTLSRGRPLAAEANRINTIVAGKNFGDTSPGTMRAMEDLEALYRKLQKDVGSQVLDTWTPPATMNGETPPAGGANGTPKWKSAPIVKPANPGPRSDAGGGAVMSDADPEGIVPGAQYASVVGRARGPGEAGTVPQGSGGSDSSGTQDNPIVLRNTEDFESIPVGAYFRTPGGGLQQKTSDESTRVIRRAGMR